MLSIPVRRTEPASVGAGLKACIEHEYHQSAERYSRDVEMIDNARGKVVETLDQDSRVSSTHAQLPGYISSTMPVNQLSGAIDVLCQYYEMLEQVRIKFPSSIQADLVWYNSLGYSSHATVSYASLQFDMTNVAYNVGALHCQIAMHYAEKGRQQESGQGSSSSADGRIVTARDSLRMAYNEFQLAAGAFHHISEHLLLLLDQPLPIGLDQDTMDALYNLMLAQAQECFWLRAMSEERIKDSSIGKLASQISVYYERSRNAMIKASASFRAEWIAHVNWKRLHFGAAAHYRMALDALAKTKYGMEIGHLRRTVELCMEATRMRELKYVGSTVVADTQGLLSKSKADLTRAERDNDVIYFQAICNVDSVGCSNMVKAVDPLPQANSVAAGAGGRTLKSHLFASLLPYRAYQVANAFKEKIEMYVEENVYRAARMQSTQLDKFMAEHGLPGSVDALELPLGVPQQLVEFSDYLRSVQGVQQLHMSMRDINNMYEESVNLLREASECLYVEETEDRYLRTRLGTERWPREPSQIVGKHLWERRAFLEERVKLGREGDEALQNNMSRSMKYLETLEAGREALEREIPVAVSVHWGTELETAMAELKQAIQRARGLQHSRSQYIKGLEARVDRIDLLAKVSEKMMAGSTNNGNTSSSISDNTKNAAVDLIYIQELAQFDKDIVWVREQEQEQSQLLEIIAERNEVFKHRCKADTLMLRRQDIVQTLEQAIYAFHDIRRTLKEAYTFYNQTRQAINELVKQCHDFVYERRMSGQELEARAAQQTTE